MPPTRPLDLPDFERPPIAELVLSIQFANLTAFRNIHAGILWQQFAQRYPNVEEYPPIAPVFEMFGVPPAINEMPQFTFVTGPNPVRYWFIAADGTELLQVQPDRLVHNWRQQKPEDAYPRYEPVRERFEAEIREVQQFLALGSLGEIKPNQCEVTYINNITLDTTDPPEAHLDDIFTIWTEHYSDGYLHRIERAQINASYVIRHDGGEPLGRLYAAIQPAVHRLTSTRLLQFSLTARGKPKDESIDAALEWLDQGRIAVVRSFTSLTRPEMHRRWGRTDAGQ
jgi:uncharacterized protein (TIGR04255 family)